MLFYNYDLEKILRANHPLRDAARVVDFRHLAVQFWKVLKTMGRRGYGLDIGIKCLFLQFWYDLSDRELEDRLRDDNGFRWFCGFGLEDVTPDHTYFTRIRTLLGAERIGEIFRMILERTFYARYSRLWTLPPSRRKKQPGWSAIRLWKTERKSSTMKMSKIIAWIKMPGLDARAKINSGTVIRRMPVWIWVQA
jgi:hypothetical protein